ncbi:MAG TPA: phasin family protein [Aliidongia sp.]|nr:phasin family protein [Aliidongia sp.]
MTESPAPSTADAAPPPDLAPFGFDPQSLIETQQRQIDAFGRATEIISSTFSAVIAKQFELLQKEAEQFASEMKLLLEVRDPADVVPKQVATARNAFDETLADLRAINDITRAGTLELFDVFRNLPRDTNLPPAPPVEAHKLPTRPSRAA